MAANTETTYSPAVEAERQRVGLVECELVGQDGNAFAILGRVGKALRRAGYSQEARDAFMADAQSGDYNHLLATAMDWVTDAGDDEVED
jgi:hypothetical protein